MASRHLARSIAMQSLYEWDFRGKDDAKLDEIIGHNIAEFGPGLDDASFVEELVRGALKKRSVIDPVIEKAAPEWPIEQVAIVDRNILRIGIYELLVITPEIENLIVRRASSAEIQTCGRKQGMVSLFEDGFEKMMAGATTIEELLRVASPPDAPVHHAKKH